MWQKVARLELHSADMVLSPYEVIPWLNQVILWIQMQDEYEGDGLVIRVCLSDDQFQERVTIRRLFYSGDYTIWWPDDSAGSGP